MVRRFVFVVGIGTPIAFFGLERPEWNPFLLLFDRQEWNPIPSLVPALVALVTLFAFRQRTRIRNRREAFPVDAHTPTTPTQPVDLG